MIKTRKTRKIEKLQKELEAANKRIAEYEGMFKDPIPTKHPELKHPIELAFEVEGEAYYRFKSEMDLASYPRYAGASEFMRAYEHRMTPQAKQVWYAAFKECYDRRDLAKCMILADEMMSRLQHLTDIGCIYQIAAQVFFTLEDDLGEVVPPDEAQIRIKKFKKKPIPEFIAIQPISSIVRQQELLSQFSGNVLNLLKTIQMEEVIKKAQEKSWSRMAKNHK